MKKLNRKAIMQNAWYIFRRNMGYYTFAESLRISWQKEKEEIARKAVVQDAKDPALMAKAKEAIFLIHMKDFWNDEDREELRRLEAFVAA